MLVVRMLLPRFLVLEVVLVTHFLHHDHCEGTTSTDSSCYIDLSRTEYPPILFWNATTLMLSLDLAEWKYGEFLSGKFVVSCPGSKLQETGLSDTPASIDCETGTISIETGTEKRKRKSSFEIKDAVHQLSCSRKIREELRVTSTSCGPRDSKAVLSQIGWTTLGNRFVPQLTVCHDIEAESTFYVNHTLRGRALIEAQTRKGIDMNSRPSYFKEGSPHFFKKSSASAAYRLKTQSSRLQRILGNSGENYVHTRKSYLARGHLAPDADFDIMDYSSSLADATYYYINVAPQWQTFNNGNWKDVENSLRFYAGLASVDLEVYTGTLGILSLRDSNGTLQELYLGGESRQNEKLIPVPEFLWKLVYDPGRNEAVVFVGLNNPFAESITTLCPDLCIELHWDEFLNHRLDISKGYVYCCSYQKFKKIVPWLPEIERPYLLQNRI